MTETWRELFPDLAGLEPGATAVLERDLQFASLPAGTVAFRSGSACETYLFILAGLVRVQMTSETGREIVLYRVEAGETCILTTACLMAGRDYPAEAVVESEVRAAVLPSAAFKTLLALSARFREFVFAAYGTRLLDLMLVVDEVAFRRIDLRLARFLLDRRDEDGRVALTHQELATELGTVREVVSRQLKDFERRGWVTLDRRRILIHAPEALAALTGG
jgi:CRP/FNR family transcriptional regulator